METTLHRQLKALYANDESCNEVTLDGFRIDALNEDGIVIEVQCASLSAIRDKIRKLVKSHDVVVVKPLIARKLLIKRSRKRGRIVSKRYSPKRESWYDAFVELVHFMSAFPHPRLTLELLLVEVEEYRLPKLAKRWRRKNYRVEDRELVSVVDRRSLRNLDDLRGFIPADTPEEFTTKDLADTADISRWLAQKMAYCLRQSEAIKVVGKQGNSIVYSRAKRRRRRRKAA